MEFNRCYGCMEPLETPGSVCPRCGYDNAAQSQPDYALPCGSLLAGGHYLIGKMLGEGGFGITYLGYNLALQMPVCVKEYFPAGAAMRTSQQSRTVYWSGNDNAQELKRGRESFVREARKAVKLRDLAAVVSVSDVFYENETAYIVMDYIRGETLKSTMLMKQRPLTEAECEEYLFPVMADLEEVHARGIIHRDIKPDNLMLQPDGKVVLLDLGAAKDLSGGSGQSSFVVASQGFAPPEQYRQNGSIGPWTDVYALCATMYYCVSGKVPPTPMDRISGEELKLEGFSRSFAAALEKGMALRQEERCQSMAELREAFRAKPEGGKSRRGARVAAAVAAVALAAGGGVFALRTLGDRDSRLTEVTPTPTAAAEEVVASPTPIPATPTPSTVETAVFRFQTSAQATKLIEYSGAGGAVEIPAENEGETVRTIGYFVFSNREDITSVVIPEGVTEICAGAFRGCKNLKSITLPSTLKSIGTDAFELCEALEEIVYSGSESQWNAVKIGSGNEALRALTAGETKTEVEEEKEEELEYVDYSSAANYSSTAQTGGGASQSQPVTGTGGQSSTQEQVTEPDIPPIDSGYESTVIPPNAGDEEGNFADEWCEPAEEADRGPENGIIPLG